MGWYEVLKDAISVAQKADNLGLLRELMDAQKEMMDMQQENFEYKKKNAELEDIINKINRIEYNADRTAVFEIDDQSKRSGPYCTHCWEILHKTISLLPSRGMYYKCPHCNVEVKLYFGSDEDLLK